MTPIYYAKKLCANLWGMGAIHPVDQASCVNASRRLVMAGTITVDWECVTDGKTPQGGNFRAHVVDFLKSGYRLVVISSDGCTQRVFEDSDGFITWFDAI